MASVGAKSAGYASLQRQGSPHEMKELLPAADRGVGGGGAGKGSVETAVAGCEEDDDEGGRGFSGRGG